MIVCVQATVAIKAFMLEVVKEQICMLKNLLVQICTSLLPQKRNSLRWWGRENWAVNENFCVSFTDPVLPPREQLTSSTWVNHIKTSCIESKVKHSYVTDFHYHKSLLHSQMLQKSRKWVEKRHTTTNVTRHNIGWTNVTPPTNVTKQHVLLWSAYDPCRLYFA